MVRSLTAAVMLVALAATVGFGHIDGLEQKFLSISYVNLILPVDSENDLVSERSTSVVYLDIPEKNR